MVEFQIVFLNMSLLSEGKRFAFYAICTYVVNGKGLQTLLWISVKGKGNIM